MNPLVSVVMSVYNSEKYLKSSIESILCQDYSNFEFIIINDGSTDSSLKILNEYKEKDKRIIILDNIKNKGLIYSLNKGIENSKGKYIARMDSDDFSRKTRLSEQVKFMEKNTEIAMCGTAATFFLDKVGFIRKNVYCIENYEGIKAASIFDCSFVHPSVIMRSSILKENNFRYNENFKYAEDFRLWAEIMPKYKVSNINKPLVKYRIVKNSITRKANKDMKQREEVFKAIFNDYLNNLNVKVSKEELDLHFEISMIQNLKTFKFDLKPKEEYLNKLRTSNESEEINKVCIWQYLKACIYQGKYGDFRKSSFYDDSPISRFQFYKKKLIERLKRIIKIAYM